MEILQTKSSSLNMCKFEDPKQYFVICSVITSVTAHFQAKVQVVLTNGILPWEAYFIRTSLKFELPFPCSIVGLVIPDSGPVFS